MLKKSNMTAVIIGGTKGIGLEITKLFLKKNFNVVVSARKINNLNLKNKNLLKISGDFSKENSHKKLVTKTLKKFGSIDVYINNVGLSDWKPIDKVDHKFLNRMLLNNFFSSVWGCKHASKKMKPGSSIINISSIAGKRGSKNNSIYSSCKFAITGLTQSLAKELGDKGIRVNSICPVLIKTPGLIKALKGKYSPANNRIESFLKEFTISNSALGRLPSGNDVAELCYFLSSSNSNSITGQNINLDCGVFPQ